jgi:hypothetical protein
MPYSIVNNHPDCDGYAVVKDSNNEVIGCHRTEAQAQDQLAAVNIAEYGERALPDNYRPADSQDVPEGRNCGNCGFNVEGYCIKWDDEIAANYYCNAWEPMAQRQQSYKPTEAMRAEAQRGLDWRKEYGRGGTAVGIARARDIAGGKSLPLETVLRMRSFFARHEVDKKGKGFSPGEDGYPSNGRIAWALWGGDPGKSWADNIAKKNENRTDRALAILKLLRKI